ncbi:hypothetical protein [Methanosarcina virus MetMV]|jgi:hypothetical protein|nr:hypothetical protein [Methanosarcina virus MetMV]
MTEKVREEKKMAITEEFLKDIHPCDEGYQWWLNHGRPADSQATLETLIADEQENWANWLIVRLMNHKQKIAYAIYAAEQVISIYKLKYPDDNRPQKAIDAAKKFLSDTSTKNKDTADAAADAVHATDAAADAVHATDAAADAVHATDAAAAVVYEADAAVYAADAAVCAANAAYAADAAAVTVYAADAAVCAANAAYAADAAEMLIKIIKHGMSLMTFEENVP